MAVDTVMTYRPTQNPFAARRAATEPVQRSDSGVKASSTQPFRDASRKLTSPKPPALMVQIRLLLSADKTTGIDSGLPLVSAKIYPFTGSNTPYQSHE